MTGLIFDMDGTLIDNMEYHRLAWQTVLRELDMDWTMHKIRNAIYGKNEEVFRRIFGNTYTNEEITSFADRKEQVYRELYKPHMSPIEGLTDFLGHFSRTAGVVLGIGTAAGVPNVDFVLDRLNLRRYFQTIVTTEEVVFGKPHPETFLKVADRLSLDPADCIVFEDVPKGIQAAKNAKMKAVGITTTHRGLELKNADRIIDSYTDLGLDASKWFI